MSTILAGCTIPGLPDPQQVADQTRMLTEMQQQMFVSSFYCYLNYHQTNDFVIDLDIIWKWLGFHAKQNAKILLEKCFIINKDYTLLIPQHKQSRSMGFCCVYDIWSINERRPCNKSIRKCYFKN